MEIRHEIRVLLAEGAGDGHPLMAGCARLLFHDAVGGGTNGCINLDIDDNRGQFVITLVCTSVRTIPAEIVLLIIL